MARHPYQCIASVRPSSEQAGSKIYLLTARGSSLQLLCVSDGSIVSEWKPSDGVGAQDESNEHEDGPPAKKQKTTQVPKTEPSVIKLAISPNQQHAVAVTDDKCVRVFSIDTDGRIAELSQRYMPKRPCAIEVMPDNATILCGDKFGDVYSLPLLPQASIQVQDETAGATAETSTAEEQPKSAGFKPSATNLTVHTMRNRKALEAQLKQKEFATKKEPLKFEHKLLLGHVSMLTDLTFATRDVEGKQRGYIVTADRDEHIRFSRAPPQSHVIEGYCLGHTEFISKICIIPGTNLLVSAGGDDWLGVWEWPAFELQNKLPLSYDDISDAFSTPAPASAASPTQQSHRLAVSGLWTIPLATGKERTSTALMVACERVPALFVIPLDRLGNDTGELVYPIMHTEGPVLDAAVVNQSVVVSYDPASAGKRNNEGTLLKAYRFGQPLGPGLVWSASDDELDKQLHALNGASSAKVDDKKLDGFLYTVAQMRKRRDHEAREEMDGEDEE